MSNSASTLAANPDQSNADPSLSALITGTALAVMLSSYWLFDTYMVRQAAPQTLENGKAYVARFSEPRQLSPTLSAGGTRLIAVLNQARDLAETLKKDLAVAADERTAREDKYQKELAALQQQSAASRAPDG